MINLKKLRYNLEKHIDNEEINAGKYPVKGRMSSISKRIIIKRKKKMMLEETKNGKVRAVRKNVIKIEIIE
jgi:hypothetical protein